MLVPAVRRTVAVVALLALAGCGVAPDPSLTPAPTDRTTTALASQPPSAAPGTSPSAPGTPSQEETPKAPGTQEVAPAVLMLPAGAPTVVADGLENPWSLVFVDGQPVFSQRSRATLSTVVAGEVVEIAQLDEVRPEAEGGLLGLAVSPADDATLYAYYTAERDNRVVSMPITRAGDSFSVGDQSVLVEGIPKARAHNGGRIAFGPDGKLYIATGDASESERSQDRDSLGGKILRLNPDGSVPADNPFDSPVWTLGHRNVQGLAWAEDGTMWATEFGQSTWDELNIIEPGANYGWPEVEGGGGGSQFREPVLTWGTDEASPSGLLHKDGNLYVAALKGQRMWVLLASDPEGSVTDVLNGDPGRLRDIVAAPDGTIWVLTSNNGGDRILSYELAAA